MRSLGIPAVADKLLQIGVSKILEEIYEQDFLACSYGYRPGIGLLDAVKDCAFHPSKCGAARGRQ